MQQCHRVSHELASTAGFAAAHRLIIRRQGSAVGAVARSRTDPALVSEGSTREAADCSIHGPIALQQRAMGLSSNGTESLYKELVGV